MRDILIKILNNDNLPFEMKLFDLWHFLYLFLILGGLALFMFLTRKICKEKQEKILNSLCILLFSLYILDFFMQPLYHGSIDIYKLPFHLCTVLAPLTLLSRFNHIFKKFKKPITTLAIVAPAMYLCYPGTAINGTSPFSLVTVQTFVYHALLLYYGALSIYYNDVTLDFKTIHYELITIIILAIWAGLGNLLYEHDNIHYDWFFLTGYTFPFINKYLMPFIVILSVFLCTIIIHLISYIVLKIKSKSNNKQII